VSQIKPTDQITTIEGLAATVGQDLHPMQQAWLDTDVAQCGYCQPGQIMTAVAKVKQAKAEGRTLTDDDLDQIRNICRCARIPGSRGDQSGRTAHVRRSAAMLCRCQLSFT